jgi:hypothetical protein
VYAVIRFAVCRDTKMKSHHNVEEIRWQVVKAMLDDFPELKGKVKSYVEAAEN